MMQLCLLVAAPILACSLTTSAFASCCRGPVASCYRRAIPSPAASFHKMYLSSSKNNNNNNNNYNKNNNKERRIVKYDNVGDPIYEDELDALQGNGMNILGVNVALDPLSLSLLVFGAIAFNFFVLANL